jgi:hypothetical protein
MQNTCWNKLKSKYHKFLVVLILFGDGMPIKLLCLSDIHAKVSSLCAILDGVVQDYCPDLITISGDITHFGTCDEVERILRVVEETGVPYCYVLGNCDPPECRNGVNVGGTCLEARCVSYPGIFVLGAGGATPTPYSTLFEVEEEEIVGILRARRSACCKDGCTSPLVLVLHNPPKGEVVDRTRNGMHVGSEKIRQFILEASPAVVQCGHIHEAVGTERIGGAVVFNPGPAQRGNYAFVEIDNENGGKVNVIHGSVQ